MLVARYGAGDLDVIIGGLDSSDHPALQEARRRVDLKGLLDHDLF